VHHRCLWKTPFGKQPPLCPATCEIPLESTAIFELRPCVERGEFKLPAKRMWNSMKRAENGKWEMEALLCWWLCGCRPVILIPNSSCACSSGWNWNIRCRSIVELTNLMFNYLTEQMVESWEIIKKTKKKRESFYLAILKREYKFYFNLNNMIFSRTSRLFFLNSLSIYIFFLFSMQFTMIIS